MAVNDRVKFITKRLGERLWVKPLFFCILSIAAVFIAKAADHMSLDRNIPSVTADSLEALLAILASSMLVIATFAVASMVSAYASASNSATPRSFTLIVADDVSQNALSTFIGAFIFSIVALTAAKNGFFQEAGLAALFALMVVVFGVVILTFVRWVDKIARLGRLHESVEKVEMATAAAMKRSRAAPALCGIPAERRRTQGKAVHSETVGYVQHIDIETLQAWAEKANGRIAVAALPGTFVEPGRALAYVTHAADDTAELDLKPVVDAFVIGKYRLFDEDPRFGLVALSEIADRALSPGVNDPGTAITIIGSLVRLFVLWTEPKKDSPAPKYDRVEVPVLSTRDMFDDAFRAIARDGAGTVEVMLRLQKAFKALSSRGDSEMHDATLAHSRMALARAEKKLDLPDDLALVREVASFSRAKSTNLNPQENK
ncbi:MULTISPECIES: DUF2254 domain-containing protein [Marinobacter]|uniref:DUF2254 domain-containing protein n=1 Tax=Marinobacter TaxID=2742 RepID=UPI00294211C8|nr:DUF2254 domain-containing protein [Marinobacter salarius]WOI18860.1 DUF2254 domain-containing protein [Marinobacter salarius]